MSEQAENWQIKVTDPSVDFSFQFKIAQEKVEKKIFSTLCSISKEFHSVDKKIGTLVVMGVFGSAADSQVTGMRRLSKSNIEKYINAMFSQFEEDVLKIFNSGNDGAIIINQSGQIIGTGIYLTVEHPSLDIPEGTGTRHISAASFSARDDVIATFTLSEETLIVRMWKDGAFVEQFNPVEFFEELSHVEVSEK